MRIYFNDVTSHGRREIAVIFRVAGKLIRIDFNGCLHSSVKDAMVTQKNQHSMKCRVKFSQLTLVVIIVRFKAEFLIEEKSELNERL